MVKQALNCAKKHAVVASIVAKQYRPDLTMAHGSVKKVSAEFGIKEQTVKRVWKQYVDQKRMGVLVPDLSVKFNERGRKSKLTPLMREHIEVILQDYADMHRYASDEQITQNLIQMGHETSKSSVHGYFKKMGVRTERQHLKPLLHEKHKLHRLKYVLDKVDTEKNARWLPQLATIHIDESWFYLKQLNYKVRVSDTITLPETPSTQHKSHIQKVMFVVAMARPQRDFDGKVGCWAVTDAVTAKRDSKNRKKGTIEQKSTTMDSAKYYEILTKEGGLLDSVKRKMPWLKGEDVTVQHDGATPHTGKGNEENLKQAGIKDGWKIKFISQPSQSPDVNILDLGFFNSLKKRIASEYASATTEKELMDAVMGAYGTYDRATLECIWGHQYAVYGMILKHFGCNNFKAPHSGVRKNQRAGNELSLAMNIKTKHMQEVKNLVEKWQINEDKRLANKNKAKAEKN